MKTKILLVDDHPLVREWLGELDQRGAGLRGLRRGRQRAARRWVHWPLSPRIAVVDISLDGGSGLELIKDIKALHPKVDVLVLSMHDEMLYAERAMRAGAAGYIMKREATRRCWTPCARAGRQTLFQRRVNAQLAQKLVQGAADKPTAAREN